MSNSNLPGSKPYLTIGTIGHAAHGKSTLSAAILKRQASLQLAKPISYAEITKGGTAGPDGRTVSVTTATLEYESAKRLYTHLDCPGLPDYTKNLYASLAQMDVAILVVDALEGLQPQSHEHLILARSAGVRAIVVFLNRCDQVTDPVEREFLESDVRELLNKWQFDGNRAPVIHGAALPALQGNPTWEASIAQLIEAIDAMLLQPVQDLIPYQSANASFIYRPLHTSRIPFLMRITDIVAVGRDAAVSGRVVRGTIKVGDEIELVGVHQTKKFTVTRIEMFRRAVSQAKAGDTISCVLRMLQLSEVNRNQVLAELGSITAHTQFDADIQLLKQDEGGRRSPSANRSRFQILLGTADVEGTLLFQNPNVTAVAAGESDGVTITLMTPIAVEMNMTFALHHNRTTVAIGVIKSVHLRPVA